MPTTTKEYYKDSFTHINEELLKTDLLLFIHSLKHEIESKTTSTERIQGIFLTKQKFDSLTNNEISADNWFTITHSKEIEKECKPYTQALSELEQKISLKSKNSIEKNIDLKFPKLAAVYGLCKQEITIILICLLLRKSKNYESLFRFLNNDKLKKNPDIGLILEIICQTDKEKLTTQNYFLSNAPLIKHNIIEFIESSEPEFLSTQIKLNDRIADFLFEKETIDKHLIKYAELIHPQTTTEHQSLLQDTQDKLTNLSNIRSNQDNLIISLSGPTGSGKKSAALYFCQTIQTLLLEIDLEAISTQNNSKKLIDLSFRESLLTQAALYFSNADLLLEDNPTAGKLNNILLKSVQTNKSIIVLSGRRRFENKQWNAIPGFITLKLPVPEYAERRQIWEAGLSGYSQISNTDIKDLAGKFRLTQGQIHDAMATAENIAKKRSTENNRITMTDLYKGCRIQSNTKLNSLAQKINPKYTWNDIVLPQDQLDQLREITNHVANKHLVYKEWGFDQKLSLGKGLNILFCGTSGTGKTMAAEIVANKLHLDLFKIDLSSIVSKYIGETEKNLSKIFSEAETSNAILFFDEADALFGKRSEVKDAHDRYANIETGYLLQKMEEYTGIVVMATNMKKNMDSAFVRRMHFTIEFPFPAHDSRLQIWEKIFPKQTPINESIDYLFLSNKLNISGGNIKNIALTSAFYAAGDGKVVTMAHVIQACKREYQKMGKACSRNDFGEYYQLLEKVN